MSINIQTTYKANVAVPYGKLQTVVDWCERNCTNEWYYLEDAHNNINNGFEFIFESEKDYVAFLIWEK